MIFDEALEGFSQQQVQSVDVGELAAQFGLNKGKASPEANPDYMAMAAEAYKNAEMVQAASTGAQESAEQANQVFAPKGPPVAPVGVPPPVNPQQAAPAQAPSPLEQPGQPPQAPGFFNGQMPPGARRPY